MPKCISHILRPSDRVFYRHKIRRVSRDIAWQTTREDFDIMHAHTLYSDGGVALRFSRLRSIPYVVTVRNTDLNLFAKFRPDLSRERNNILANAAQITVLSPAYADRLCKLVGRSMSQSVMRKVTVIPNGIEQHWFDDTTRVVPRSHHVRLLFVGSFDRGKNVSRLLDAVAIIARSQPIELTLVGGGGNHAGVVESKLASGRFSFASFLGRIDDPDELRKVYRDHDIFVMPSLHETFGLVYIEALSQGLPIIHSHMEGVDGFFEKTGVAFAVDPRDTKDIARKLSSSLSTYRSVGPKCREQAKRFQWSGIAQEYLQVYRSAMTNESGGLQQHWKASEP